MPAIYAVTFTALLSSMVASTPFGVVRRHGFGKEASASSIRLVHKSLVSFRGGDDQDDAESSNVTESDDGIDVVEEHEPLDTSRSDCAWEEEIKRLQMYMNTFPSRAESVDAYGARDDVLILGSRAFRNNDNRADASNDRESNDSCDIKPQSETWMDQDELIVSKPTELQRINRQELETRTIVQSTSTVADGDHPSVPESVTTVESLRHRLQSKLRSIMHTIKRKQSLVLIGFAFASYSFLRTFEHGEEEPSNCNEENESNDVEENESTG